jgi:uncharacterized membrane protein
LILVYSLGYVFNFTIAIIPGFFFLFLYLGLMLKHTKRNYFVGLRTPWTLNNEDNWNKTHAFSSKLFIGCAFISLFGIIFQNIAFILLVAPLIASAIISIIYSYFIYKLEKKKKLNVYNEN